MTLHYYEHNYIILCDFIAIRVVSFVFKNLSGILPEDTDDKGSIK